MTKKNVQERGEYLSWVDACYLAKGYNMAPRCVEGSHLAACPHPQPFRGRFLFYKTTEGYPTVFPRSGRLRTKVYL